MRDRDLEKLLVPEDARERLDLRSPVSRLLVLATGIVGVGACVLMWWGGGGPLTWVGAAVYLVFLLGFTALSHAGVDTQADRVDRAIREAGDDGVP